MINRVLVVLLVLFLQCSNANAKEMQGGFYGIPWGATKEAAEQIVGTPFVKSTGFGKDAYEADIVLFDKNFKAILIFGEVGFYHASISMMDYVKMEDAVADLNLFTNAFIKKYGKPTTVDERSMEKTHFILKCEWFLPDSQIGINSFGLKGENKEPDYGMMQVWWKSRLGKDLDKI